MSSAGSEAVALVSSVLVSSCGSAGSSLVSAGAVGAEVFSTGGRNIKNQTSEALLLLLPLCESLF